MITLGITGSIGMGKSTVSKMFRRLGVAVHDSDVAVHQALCPGGAAIAMMRKLFPMMQYPQIYKRKYWIFGTVSIDRKALGEIVFFDAKKREALENILHPIVRKAQQKFLCVQQNMGCDIAALDIPLLYETGAQNRVDYVLVASAPDYIQRARVMERPGMSTAKFDAILARQMPDGEKRVKADFVIETGLGKAATMKQVKQLVYDLRAPKEDSLSDEQNRKLSNSSAK